MCPSRVSIHRHTLGRAIETAASYNCGDPTGKEATMEALFDDVMISGPLLSASPKSNDFGGVIIRTVSAEKAFTLSNSGTRSIGIDSIDLVGGDASMFNVASGTCSTLSPTLGAKKIALLKPHSGRHPALPRVKNQQHYALLSILQGVQPFMCILKGTAILETIPTPSSPSGRLNGTTGTTYTYSITEGSSSNLGHPIQYLFDGVMGPTPGGYLLVRKVQQRHGHPMRLIL